MLWYVDPPKIMGSSHPDESQILECARQGIQTVICLLSPHQPLRYSPENLKKHGIAWYHIQIEDFCAPTLEQFQSFFQILDERLPHGGVLFHCQAGCGRTGTMAAAYWIRQGLSAPQAINKVRQSNPHAVETQEQMQSLKDLEKQLQNPQKEK
ncbi:MAG: protein tyrosine phosphatase [Planctomycetota bacterium]|nr:MAG: protein tyrosine phosphatase [Planctomycetota bacterium]